MYTYKTEILMLGVKWFSDKATPRTPPSWTAC